MKHSFDGSIPPIANPSLKTEVMGIHLDECTKANALYPPLYPDLNSASLHPGNGNLVPAARARSFLMESLAKPGDSLAVDEVILEFA